MMIFLLRPIESTPNSFEKVAFEYAEDLKHRYRNRKYIDFHELQTESDPVENFKGKIREHEGTAYFVAYSHGSEHSLILVTHGVIFGTADCDIFRDKYCYLVACNSMIGFGPSLVSAGAKGVIGYKGEFWTFINTMNIDYIEKLKKCVNNGIILFLESTNNIKEIYEGIRKIYLEIQKEILRERGTSERELLFLGMINWNMSKLDFLPK